MSPSFTFRGLRSRASEHDPDLWEYLPLSADVQRDANNAPLLNLVDLGQSAYLLFTARWEAEAGDLEALRGEIAARSARPDAGRIRFSFAPVGSPRCNALIGDGGGTFETAASSATSGYPPYHAVFNLFLEGERLGRAKAALRGETGFLGIEYLAELAVPVAAHASFRARAADLLPWMRARLSGRETDLTALLDEAIRSGLASVTIDAPEAHLEHVTVQLYERLLAEVAGALPRWLDQGTTGAIGAQIDLERTVDEPIRAFADVGALVAAGSIHMLPGGPDAAN